MVHIPYLRRLILYLDSNSICIRRKIPKVDMGICASIASEIHDDAYGQENAVYYREIGDTNGVRVIGSTYSHPGSKGFNQDSAILYQVCQYCFVTCLIGSTGQHLTGLTKITSDEWHTEACKLA